MGIIACFLAFAGTYAAARKSLGRGILCSMLAGYAYGIFRAHFVDTVGYFLFDLSVLGLYAGSIQQIMAIPESRAGKQLRHWTWLLVLLPLMLVFIPLQDPMVQLVGFRGNAFLLPFLLLGAGLADEDIREIGLGMSALNLMALAIAVAEFMFGVDRFIPNNAVTDLIFSSHDVGSMNAYRIPATFANAHTYGGQMVMSLPFIIGTWSQRHRKAWEGPVLTAGVLAAILGVFLSAARIHFVTMVVTMVVFTLSSKLRPSQRVAWVVILAIAGYLVAGHERMQRFTTLDDEEMVTTRIEGSVNASFLDALEAYPMGNGLGGGGTSLPYFLIDRARIPLIIESEYARIQLELGFVGLALWLGFLGWFFTRPKPVAGEPWFVGKRLAWVICLMSCAIGMIGTGLLTAIPCSGLMLLMFGWLAAPKAQTRTAVHPAPGFDLGQVRRLARPAPAFPPVRQP